VQIVCQLIRLYTLVVIARIVMGMVIEFGRIPWGHPVRRIGDILGMAVDPVLRPIRNLIPGVPMGGMTLDLSPIILIVGLGIIARILCS
jgi:YggT family protein